MAIYNENSFKSNRHFLKNRLKNIEIKISKDYLTCKRNRDLFLWSNDLGTLILFRFFAGKGLFCEFPDFSMAKKLSIFVRDSNIATWKVNKNLNYVQSPVQSVHRAFPAPLHHCREPVRHDSEKKCHHDDLVTIFPVSVFNEKIRVLSISEIWRSAITPLCNSCSLTSFGIDLQSKIS